MSSLHFHSAFIIYMNRKADNEGYVVVINVAGLEEKINLSVFPLLPKELTVETAAPNSRLKVG